MCEYNFNDKKDVKKWLLKNHPDKGGKVDVDVFNKILECYTSGNLCKTGSTKTKKTKTDSIPKGPSKTIRKQIFSCMRKKANFSSINKYHKFDKPLFNEKLLNEQMKEASPKMLQLLNNIKTLDENDMKKHGKKFKHFIFSDVKDGGYGAKIISAMMIANGFNNLLKARKVKGQKKLKLYLDLSKKDKNNFAMLCSNSLFNSTITNKLKKELLSLFNKRPDNINGELIRFIIFDSGFKEGIDLFDVKYVHIFEPSLTIADLKQTIGRATRTCGQKGLEFQKDIGWPLYVYNYFLTVPENIKESFYTSEKLMENKKLQKGVKDRDVLLFGDVNKYNDATIKYSEFDKAMNNLSIQLFDLASPLSVDFFLTKNIHNIEDLNEKFMEKTLLLTGGAKSNIFKKTNQKSKYYKIDNINCNGNCGNKTTKDVPVSLDFMKKVYKFYKHPNNLIPKTNQRAFFCEFMKYEDNGYCGQLNREWNKRYAEIPNIVEDIKSKDVKEKLENMQLILRENPEEEEILDEEYKILNYTGSESNGNKNFKKMNFKEMRDYIRKNYNSKKYKWEKIVVENKCIEKNTSKFDNKPSIEFNPSQNFIKDFFVPESPYKGMLLWHSVGTGKTCTGVATASSSFEREDYTILWVTRTTLKSDVWKNIFDQVCHTILMEKINNGLILPESFSEKKKLMSKKWFDPLSYKQFSNLLARKNEIYDKLREINGDRDILKKTLVIIDEAHKLYGGDLKGAEKPNTDVMEKLIKNSYKVSGKDSCKILLMTATPFTNSPLELFKLINLFIENDRDLITTDKQDFIKEYMNNDNILSDNGVKKLSNQLTGYISYLNREKDPTQFAQPILIDVPVMMTGIKEEEAREILFLGKKVNNIEQEAKNKIKALKEKIKALKSEYKEKNAIYKETTNSDKELKDSMKKELKDIMIKIKSLEKELEIYNSKNSDEKVKLSKMKEKLREIKKGLIQEYLLFKKCQHIKFIKSKTKKQNRLHKSDPIKNKSKKLSTRLTKSI